MLHTTKHLKIKNERIMQNDGHDTDRHFLIVYIILCCIAFCVIYLPAVFQKYSNIYLDIGADTFSNYLPSYVFSQKLIRNFTFWDTTLGLGSETSMQAANYLADPFAWIVLLFSPLRMSIGLWISLTAKYIVLCGVSYQYFRVMDLSRGALILAALSTNFCGWMVGWGQHYHFSSFFVFFISALYFMEKWIRKKQWMGFVFSLALIVAKSAYFGYMTLFFLAGYYLVRAYTVQKEGSSFPIKKFIINGTVTCLLVAAALLLAAMCFFPEVETILSSPRTGKNIVPTLQLAGFREYGSFVLRIFGNSILGTNSPYLGWRNFYESPFMYVGILSVFFCLIALKEKWCRALIIFVFGICLFCIPVAICFNAFNTVTYRWTFFFVPLLSLLSGKGFEIWIGGGNSKKAVGFGCVLINGILLAYLLYLRQNHITDSKSIFYSMLTAFVCSLLYTALLFQKNRKRFSVILLTLFSLELGAVGWLTAVCERSLISMKTLPDWEYFSPSNILIEQIKQQDTDFYRINKLYGRIHLNDSMAQNYRGEKLYSSTLHPSYWSIRKLFDLPGDGGPYFYGFEDRQSLRDINCGKYMLSQSDASYYGYEKTGESGNGYFAYKNNNAFPFGTQFQYYISESDYRALSLLDQDAVLYDALILPDELAAKMSESGIESIQTIHSGTLTSVPLQTEETDNGYQVQLDSANEFPLIIELHSQSDSRISGAVHVLDDEGNRTSDEGKNFQITGGGVDQCMIHRQGVSRLEIAFDTPGHDIQFFVYLFVPDEQQLSIQQKQDTGMKNIAFKDASYVGEIVLQKSSLVYFPVLYDDNWKLRANDIEVPVLCVNGGFCAASLAAGEYTLEFYYEPWLQRFSIICSISTFLIIISVYATEHVLVRRKRGASSDAQTKFLQKKQ